MRLALFALLAAFALAGCSNPCIKLAEKICECQTNTVDREACNQRASNEKAQIDLTRTDEDRCAALVDKCDCHALATPEGKRNCGLARELSFP